MSAYRMRSGGEHAPAQQTIVKLVSAPRRELHLQPDGDRFLVQLAHIETRALDALNCAHGIKPPDAPT